MSTTRLETYTIAGLPPREGLSYWNRLMHDTFDSGAVCAPLDEARFSAQLARLKLGDVQFVEVCSPATAVRHVDAPRAGSRKLYVLQLQLEGNEREAPMRAGGAAPSG